MAVEGGVVKYYRNGTLVYTSTVVPGYPLQVDASLNTVNSGVYNVVISGARLAASPVNYVFQDVQGSTRAVMSGSSVIARHDFQAFGEELAPGIGLRNAGLGFSLPDKIRKRYAMTERDDTTGLDHTWWRKYDDRSGRWTSPDPYGGSMSTANPQSFNRFAYVQNDPINLMDPSGLMAICLISEHWDGRGTLTVTWDCFVSGGGRAFNPGDVGGGLGPGRDPGGRGDPNPQNPAQTPQDNRSSNQKACDDKIAGIFGGPGAVAATVAEPTTLLSDNRNRNPSAAFSHLAGGGVFHIYTNARGTEATVGLFKPPGGRLVSGGEYENEGDTENYFRFSYTRGPLKGVTLSFVHVGGTHGGDAGGQNLGRFPGEPNRIGNIGGLGGEGFGYNHTHTKVYYKGKLTDPRTIFCKEFGF